MTREYILIAEDDEDDQLLLGSAFRDIASERDLIFVANGIELIEHFNKFDKGLIRQLPSLLIVDLNMPRKNGREAIKELVDKEYFRNFHTVIFSTTGNEMEKSRCRELGIDHYVVKPSNYSTLLDIVARFRDLADSVK